MANLVPSTFCRYEFSSQQELLQAQILSPIQLQWIQTCLSDAAEERLRLNFDPTSPEKFIQAEANLKGQIEAFQYLVACSQEAAEQVKILA